MQGSFISSGESEDFDPWKVPCTSGFNSHDDAKLDFDLQSEEKILDISKAISSDATDAQTEEQSLSEAQSTTFGFDNTDVTSENDKVQVGCTFEYKPKSLRSSANNSRRPSIVLNTSDEQPEVAVEAREAPAASKLDIRASFTPFKPTSESLPSFETKATESSTLSSGLDSLNLNNQFTPSTPYVHKFRTELCKNFQLYGKCKYGDEVSYFFDELRLGRDRGFIGAELIKWPNNRYLSLIPRLLILTLCYSAPSLTARPT